MGLSQSSTSKDSLPDTSSEQRQRPEDDDELSRLAPAVIPAVRRGDQPRVAEERGAADCVEPGRQRDDQAALRIVKYFNEVV